MPSGVLTFQFGVYDGELNEAGLRHGFGKLKYNNGNEVEGQWVDGGLTGVGKKTFANGDVYEGSFETGKKHGHGTYTFKAVASMPLSSTDVGQLPPTAKLSSMWNFSLNGESP
eukprot:gene6103-9374_t